MNATSPAATATTATTAATRRSRLRSRAARLGMLVSLFALPLGVGGIALAGAANAAEPKTVHTSDGRSVDALGGKHSDGFGADGSYDPHAHVVWWAAGERFTESHHDGCNPYTFIYGGVETDPRCPVGQVTSDWNVDFTKDALQQAGFRTYDLSSSDLTTFWGLGLVTNYYHHVDHPQDDYVPLGGDVVLFTDASGEQGAVGVVLEAKSASKVKVTVGDVSGKLVTKWIDPATATVRGFHVTSYVTPDYQG
ncbi:hypothetical protein FHN55_15045 [Streptomyces sp. NP160]|uniref:hypothetical protein n=1 Tax=Streptomyces sp. NP160 TaxID=2586637 RepID=UPI0011184208|nr:hypothetical protein [Streptomyces sp. NP160]TNM64139.1 hypothetical protein FHN55_15045 [Streptomyces sp. NP160]